LTQGKEIPHVFIVKEDFGDTSEIRAISFAEKSFVGKSGQLGDKVILQ